jgi:DNA (cytosine-5)-methyltransferase 1
MTDLMNIPFKVIDVFAGSGGLGEGFSALGYDTGKSFFKLALSIEKDPSSHSTLMLRSFYRQFHPDEIPQEYWSYAKGSILRQELFDLYPAQLRAATNEAQCLELGMTPRKDVKQLIENRLKGSNKWVLIGGPPCQAYSLIGRARMRNSNPDFEKDERHFLYKEYLRIIADHHPPVFVMENVKGMLSAQHSGKKIIANILEDLRAPSKAMSGRNTGLEYRLFSLVDESHQEECEPEAFLVEAEKYGIPQARHRVLILGIRKDINITPEILKKESETISVAQVISDLPKIRSKVSKEPDTLDQWREILGLVKKSSWYNEGKLNGLLATTQIIDKALEEIEHCNLYADAEALNYSTTPRVYSDWYRSGCDVVVINHTGRSHMRSDLHRYLFASSFASANGKNIKLRDFPKALLPTHKNINEGVHQDHFGDRFRVQMKCRPSTTITSHISKDGNYFIHYDPSQCRSLTVREAARLQTFPDSYKFEGNRTSQYHQVGNAVPPLLAMKVAEIVYDILKGIKD